MADAKPEPSLGQLFGELAQETGTLVRQEVQLAKAEMTGKANAALRDVGLIAVGGALAHAGLLVLLAALVAGLSTWMPVWVAALVVGLVVLGVGGFMASKALGALRRIDPIPERTVQTMKDNQAWAKEQIP